MLDPQRSGRGGPFWGRGHPDPAVLARIIVHASCSWSEFLDFDDDLQDAIWRELNPTMLATPPVPPPTPLREVPVVRASSADFAALTRNVRPL